MSDDIEKIEMTCDVPSDSRFWRTMRARMNSASSEEAKQAVLEHLLRMGWPEEAILFRMENPFKYWPSQPLPKIDILPVKRKPGRPAKPKIACELVPKRPRGRPRKGTK